MTSFEHGVKYKSRSYDGSDNNRLLVLAILTCRGNYVLAKFDAFDEAHPIAYDTFNMK